MNTEEYYKMHRMEDRMWWFRGRRKIVLGQLRYLLGPPTGQQKPILADIGCGTGRLMPELAQIGTPIGVDIATVALGICKQNNAQYMRVARANAIQLPILDNSIDAITALDILEHLPDDAKALEEFHRIIKPGGGAVITVPAHPNLWGMHDIALHHKRRYKTQELKNRIANAGFNIERLSYAMMPAYPAAWLWRKHKNLHNTNQDAQNAKTDDFLPPKWINETLYHMLKAEAAWLTRGHTLPFGLSIIAVIRKPIAQS